MPSGMSATTVQEPTVSGGIFISYRRSDAQGWAGHLGEALAQTFGITPLFFDLESIKPGEDFIQAIEEAVASASVVLAIIGPAWLTATLPDGKRRLDDSTDFVRLELAAALYRGVRVIPVLVGGAAMPKADDLPTVIASLARRQALELTDARWNYDFDQLATAIEAASGCARLAAATGNGGLEGNAISVGAGAVIEGVEAEDVAGVKTDGTLPPPERPIDVLRGAAIKNSKVRDIVGIKLEQGRKDGKP